MITILIVMIMIIHPGLGVKCGLIIWPKKDVNDRSWGLDLNPRIESIQYIVVLLRRYRDIKAIRI